MKHGERYGRLVATERKEAIGGHKRWLCSCDCGNTHIVTEGNLRTGATRSCGCLSRETTGNRVRTHGLGHTPEYAIWKAMKRRCFNKNCRDFAGYGGRGITVCDRWRDSFLAFYEDIGPRPSPSHSIDRIDGKGRYSPDNCRWATATEQVHNSSRIRLITANGMTLPLIEWSRRTGLQSTTIAARIRCGWSAERAVNTPT